VIAELEKLDCRIKMKNRLIERLKTDEKFAYSNLKTDTPAGKRRNQMFSGLIGKTLTDSECESDLISLFHALTHVTKDNADPDFILPLIQRVAMPKYSSLSSLDAGFMRKAICHLDLIWYKHITGKGTQTTPAVKAI